MTVVVLGVDALDPELLEQDRHPDLVLESHRAIETIVSSAGSPSTHELWPTIITGLPPAEHGLELDDGVAWENPMIAYGSRIADHVLPDAVQSRIGAWLLNNTAQDAFRTPATYYGDRGIETVFDGVVSTAIGVPNYVVDTDASDREHELRRRMGSLFERDPEAATGHRSADPETFYEQCLEMAMIRIARVRRALRSGRNELVFGYTSGLDLLGHVAHDDPGLQQRGYDELDDFVGELHGDLDEDDELVLVSDHGLQDGLHTETAVIAATSPGLIDDVESVLDVRHAIETALDSGDHAVRERSGDADAVDDEEVREHLEDLGYM
jgi:predicted AlkP superfamily phosphohydrolase/phosphomutase